MGWKWSVVLAQQVHENIVIRHVEGLRLFADRRLSPSLDTSTPVALAYIDDGSVMSTSQAVAQATHDRIDAEWSGAGFELHEGKGRDATDAWEKKNGVLIDGKNTGLYYRGQPGDGDFITAAPSSFAEVTAPVVKWPPWLPML